MMSHNLFPSEFTRPQSFGIYQLQSPSHLTDSKGYGKAFCEQLEATCRMTSSIFALQGTARELNALIFYSMIF